MLYFIEFLRAIATALITNSHFKGVYPNDILSFGGGMGLALFFMISGYLQSNINENTRFWNWYVKKVIRIYIPLYIVKGIQVLIGVIKITSIEQVLRIFVFPGSWFGASFLILHIIYYFFVKFFLNQDRKTEFYILGSLIAVVYILLFIIKPSIATFSLESLKIEPVFSVETPYIITQCVWLFSMFLGLWIKRYGSQNMTRKSRLVCYGVVFLSTCLFACIKIMSRNAEFAFLQFFLALSYICFAYSTFLCFMSMEAELRNWFGAWHGKLLLLVSQSSLEIYYVQSMWINSFKQMIFPINWFLIVISIILSAYGVHMLAAKLIDAIIGDRKNKQ